MYTKVLLDTNILIEREDNMVLSEPLQKFSEITNRNNIKIYIHPLSLEDIKRDKDSKRKEITLSKIKTYPQLSNPPKIEEDKDFLENVKSKKPNDYVDNSLLYALYKENVDFLVTEDLGIHKTAQKFNLEEQVLTLDQAINVLNIKEPFKPASIKKTTANTLDLNDPIFDTLKEDYEEFETWFNKIVKEERDCLIYTEKGKLGAVLIYKQEDELIELLNQTLPSKNRLKISTMVVSSTGNKIGELFIYWIVNYAINLGCEELYLTHFTKDNDYLVYLIEEYGFENKGKKARNEDVFIKNINKKQILSKINESTDSALNIAKKYYPNFCDNEEIRKFIVPIKPEFHEKLFLKSKTQTKIESFTSGGFEQYPPDLVAVNPIKKAYLTKSKVKLKPGDLLLFSESNKKGISDIGIVESSRFVDNLQELLQIISKRSVYSLKDLEEIITTRTNVILFIHCKTYKNKISYDELMKLGIIKGPVQSIQSLNHDKYLILKEKLKEREKQI